MCAAFPSPTCDPSIRATLVSPSLRQVSRGQERSMCSDSSSASCHKGDSIDRSLASQRRVRSSRYGKVAPRPAWFSTASRLVKMLLVRRHVLERIGRAELVHGEREIGEPCLATVRTPPFGQKQYAV